MGRTSGRHDAGEAASDAIVHGESGHDASEYDEYGHESGRDAFAVDGGVERERVLVVNPTSGSEDHVDTISALAEDHGFAIWTTNEAGDGRRLAREAAVAGVSLIAAAGGDGTINEVVNGVADAGALDAVELAVVPTGTGNNFAANLGVESVEHAFDLIESGERRTVDVGEANDRLFVNSCVGGITAEASAATTSDRKRELGVLAYVVSTIHAVRSFDPLPLRVETADGAPRTWRGEAAFVLVGNARRFPGDGGTQANVEDGLFEVTIVERAPTIEVLRETALNRVFGHDTEHVVRLETSELTVTADREEPVEYSLDGEMLETGQLSIHVRERTLTIPVGEVYEPSPGPFS